MFDIFQNTSRPENELFFHKNDPNDIRLGEIVSSAVQKYESSEIIILGCPQDEGVARNKGRIGAALAPDAIRAQFYKLTNFGIKKNIFDLGNTNICGTLEETHEIHIKIVKTILKDEKRIIVLGGGNDISYADGRAMAETFGFENWLAVNIDAHFDVRKEFPRNSGTPYRQLLDEKHLKPENFFEIAYQPQSASPVYFEYLKNLGVTMVSLDELHGGKSVVKFLKEIFTTHHSPLTTFYGFDVDSVRASDAPGVSASSPIGLKAEEFIELAKFAGQNPQTRIIEFTEVNPKFDVDNRTAKLVAYAMHELCTA
ncbi:MAG: formimidoylglutamase [Acidobacteriota bacterium]|jgi:formiminoglutamase|nr:formimidoylglutamase [Acidobacteriota bacterium]